MHRLRAVIVTSSVAVLIAGCQQGAPDERSDSNLVIKSADRETGIEAVYSEGSHALVLRSRPDGDAMRSEILDDQGHDVVRLASTILERTPVRTPQGALTVPVHGLFENARTLRTALQVSRHGIRRLGDTVTADVTTSAAFRHLSQQTTVLRNALNQTRLAILQVWGNDARNQLTLTPEEHAKFFAILNRQAARLMAVPGGKRRAPVAGATAETSGATTLDAEMAALLGPERYAQYQTRRKTFLAPTGEQDLEVAP
jgi:hypothetical protein